MSLLKKFIHSAFWLAGTSYGFYAVNLVGQIILARLLSPVLFGIYVITLAVRELCIALIGFSTTTGYIYSDGSQHEFNVCFQLNLCAALIMVSIGIIGGGCFLYFYNITYALMFLIICIGQSLAFIGNVYLAPLEYQLNYKLDSLIRGFSLSGGLYLSIIFAWLGASVWSLALREFLFGGFILIFGWIVSPMKLKKETGKLKYARQLCFGLKFSVSRILEVLYSRLPDILINILLGSVSLGNFYQARYISYIPNKLTQPFTEKVLFSFLTKFKNNKEKFSQYLEWLNYLLVRIFLPFSLFVFLFGSNIFHYIYGERWIKAGYYFSHFSLFMLFFPIFSTLRSACYSLAFMRYVTQAYFIALLFFVTALLLARHIDCPAIIFSLGFVIGYFYLFYHLKFHSIFFSLKNLFQYPTFIMAIITSLYFFGVKSGIYLYLIFIILYLVLLFIERDKLLYLYQFLKKIRK